MAKETLIRLTDDIDGSEAVETVTFAFQGAQYEIDLNDKHVAALEKSLAKFVANARSAGATRRPPAARRVAKRARKAAASAGPAGSIREWAHANGYEVGERGRIPASVREAYEASL